MKILLPPGWPRPKGYANGGATMVAVEVSALIEDSAKVEIEVTTRVPA